MDNIAFSDKLLGWFGSRCPLARSESFHACVDRGVDEAFLARACFVFLLYDERKHGVHSLEELSELFGVAVVRLDPGYARSAGWGVL